MKNLIFNLIYDLAIIALGFYVAGPGAKAFFGGNSAEAVAYLLPLLLALLAAQFAYNFHLMRRDINEQVSSISDKIDQPDRLSVLGQNEFYVHLEKNIISAERAVYLTFLDQSPPTKYGLQSSETYKYYRKLKQLIRGKNEINFRRVELFSEEKIDWLEKLIKDFGDSKNFSLRVLCTEHAEAPSSLLSIQTIDGKKTYCVAVAEHQSDHKKRDIYLSSPEATDLWNRYYEEKLWSPSISIIDRGEVNWETWEGIKNAR